MKLPTIKRMFARRSAPLRKPQQTTLKATARRAEMAGDYEEEEPTTKLSSAFIVVLILHVVAVGGIYLFNSIKAHRKSEEPLPPAPPAQAATAAKPAPAKAPAAPATNPPDKIAIHPQPAAAVAQPLTLPSGARVYRVQPGDNLTKIATQYGATVTELEDANNLSHTAMLRPGQTITIPAQKPIAKPPVADAHPAVKKPADPVVAAPTPAPPAPADKTAVKTYAVKKGDTAISIAKSLGVSMTDLIKLNNITDPTKLRLGQTLKIPAKKK